MHVLHADDRLVLVTETSTREHAETWWATIPDSLAARRRPRTCIAWAQFNACVVESLCHNFVVHARHVWL